MNQKCRTGWLYSSWKNLTCQKVSLGNFFAGRPECGCTRKYFAHIFCLAELLLCHLCLFLRTGQIWQFSVLYSNSRSEQTTTVNKHPFTFLFRDICKEHLVWEHNMSCHTAMEKDIFSTGVAFLAMVYQRGKSPALLLAVGRQCRPQNRNCETVAQ